MVRHVLVLSLLSLVVVANAEAQDPALVSARTALARYDVEGTATFAALEQLGPLATRTGPSATEARYLRAIAGADLLALSIVTSDDTLAARLASSLGVPAGELEHHLRGELDRSRAGIYRASVAEELSLLDGASSFDLGQLTSVRGPSGARGDALFVLGLARVLATSRAELADAASPAFPADRDASATLSAVQAAVSAYGRIQVAVRHGDPWLEHLALRLAPAIAAIRATEIRPRVPVEVGVVAPSDAATGAAVDVVIALDTSTARLACAPILTVTDAAAISSRTVSAHCSALPAFESIALGALPPVPRAVDGLTAALRAAELAGAQTIALAPAPDVPFHVVVRALLSLEAAGLAATHLALRAQDGTLVTVAVRPAHAAQLGSPEMTIRHRLGGYTVARGRGREVSVPRVHGASGLEFDRAGLDRSMRERPPSSVAIEAMANVPASEVVETARLATAAGASATISLP